jgi:hypothetical protein
MLEIIITILGTNFTKQLLPICKQLKWFVRDSIKDEEWSTTQNTLLFIKYFLTQCTESIESLCYKTKKSIIDINVLDIDLNLIQKKRSNSGEKKTSLKLKINNAIEDTGPKSAGRFRGRSIEMECNNKKEAEVIKGPRIVEYESVNSQFFFDKELGRYFCESFFIAGLPEKDAKLINNSESFVSSCCHQECAILPSFRPNILYRMPFKDTKNFELTHSVILLIKLGCWFMFPHWC